ncbi:MAG: transglycosylase SLT domain-containing protein, partial [bacterium]
MGQLAGLLAQADSLAQQVVVAAIRNLTEAERRYLSVIQREATAQGVEATLIMAHVVRESSFNHLATHRDVDGGMSYGLMQLRLETARELVRNPKLPPEVLFNPDLNVQLGTRYIAKQLARYGGSYPDAIAAYNAGTARRDSLGRYVNSRGVPNVQAYVDGVLAALVLYRQGLSAVKGGLGGPSRAWVWAAGAGVLVLGAVVM